MAWVRWGANCLDLARPAESQPGLAAVLIEQGDLRHAEDLARQALAEFERERSLDDRVWALDVLARSLLAQNRVPEADSTIEQMGNLADRSVAVRLSAAITASRVQAAHGHMLEAIRALRAAQNQAKVAGFAPQEREASLALAKLDTTSIRAQR